MIKFWQHFTQSTKYTKSKW